MRRKVPLPDQDPLEVAQRRAGTAVVPNSPVFRRVGGDEVRRVSVTTRALVVIPAEHFGENPRDELEGGAIVWVEPPPTAEDVEVEAYKEQLLDAGAVMVKVLPRPAADEPLPRSVHDQAAVDMSVRAVVMELVGEVDAALREPVRGMVEEALAKAGL